jgi:hypothetical protein
VSELSTSIVAPAVGGCTIKATELKPAVRAVASARDPRTGFSMSADMVCADRWAA